MYRIRYNSPALTTNQFGGQVYNQTLLDKVENANLKYNVDRRVSQLRWAKPGDKAQFLVQNHRNRPVYIRQRNEENIDLVF